MFEKIKDELRIIKKERFCNLSFRDRTKQRAEQLWKENPSRSDLDNWLLAEKQIQYEDYISHKKMREKQELISRLLLKFYKK
tara:strand:+ start:628 stop:873 length:246 start_codon:yes stop_codon:yes gene_type:complete